MNDKLNTVFMFVFIIDYLSKFKQNKKPNLNSGSFWYERDTARLNFTKYIIFSSDGMTFQTADTLKWRISNFYVHI